MKQNYLVIGASAAGINAVGALRKHDAHSSITCLAQEQEFPYNKCFLADYLSGTKAEQSLYLKNQSFFDEHSISLKLGHSVTLIDRVHKKVVCSNGSVFHYTKLLLAVGSSMHMPPIEGLAGAQNVFQFYTLNDAQSLNDYVREHGVKHAVVIGGGLSGLECADSLQARGVVVTIVEREAHVLPRQITDAAAQFLHQAIELFGARLHVNTAVQKVIQTQGKITEVILENGTTILTDLLICALGVRPNSALAHGAGLILEHGAVVTNEWLQTSDPDIFAAGDVALVTDIFTGEKIRSCSWPDALQQGTIAATNMSGAKRQYPGTTTMTSTSCFGVKIFVAGAVKDFSSSYNAKLCTSHKDLFEYVIFLNDIVKGFISIGKSGNSSMLRQSLLTQTPYQKRS